MTRILIVAAALALGSAASAQVYTKSTNGSRPESIGSQPIRNEMPGMATGDHGPAPGGHGHRYKAHHHSRHAVHHHRAR